MRRRDYKHRVVSTGSALTVTGGDLLSRLIYGSRPALGLVALVTIITLPVGLLIGILAGYYGGWLERVLMRFTDIVMSMPRLILAFAFVAMLGPGLVNGALALALTTACLCASGTE